MGVTIEQNIMNTSKLTLIAGPCVLNDYDTSLYIAEQLSKLTSAYDAQLIFKASFDKANRTSINSPRGPGIEEGLTILDRIKHDLGILITTDIHEPCQAAPVAQVCDLIQIPAFLSRQTDLIVAAAKTGKAINIKKGQFMSPSDAIYATQKACLNDHCEVLLTERGTFFGYGDLVNDMRSVIIMSGACPVIYDVTHSIKSHNNDFKLHNRLAMSAIAAGAVGLFIETYPDPKHSLSDNANILPLYAVESIIANSLKIFNSI